MPVSYLALNLLLVGGIAVYLSHGIVWGRKK